MSFGMQVAANARQARKFVFSSSRVVTGFLTRYAQYEILYREPQTDKHFDSLLTNAYKAILLYVIALNDYLQQCRAGTFSSYKCQGLTALIIIGHLAGAVYKLDDRSISEKKKTIDDADTEVKDYVSLLLSSSRRLWLIFFKLHIVQTKIISQWLLKIKVQSLPEPSKPLRDCLKSLAFEQMEDRSNQIKTAAKGTCEWLLGHELYTSWAVSDRTLLWIKGKPGSGKSTLLRYALENVMKVPNTRDRALVLSFFFHNRGSELQKTRFGLFRSLLHQVLRQVPDALVNLTDTFQQRCENRGKLGKDWKWDPNELQRFFESSLQKVLDSYSVWLFVDALDESGKETAVDLVRGFKSLLQELPPTKLPFRICFTCRQYPILDLDYGFEIALEQENGQDISDYVHDRLSTFSVRMSSTIPDLITKHASGLFIWARLVVEHVLKLECDGEGVKRIEKAIGDIPQQLDELYLRLVQDMDKKPDSLKLIQWICFATRSLSLDELRWAMILDADCPHESLQQCKDAEDYVHSSETMETRLKVLSHGLAEVVPSSSGRVVQFIHQTVRDFFVEKGLSLLGGNLKSAGTETDLVGIAHHRLSRSCIRYLAMKEIGQSTIDSSEDLRSEFPLLRYATTSWLSHVKQSEENNVSQDDLLNYFAWPSEALLQLWVQVYGKIEPLSYDPPGEGASTIHIASRYQLVGLLRAILQKTDQIDVDINARDWFGRTPLSWAAANGHEAVIKLLLETGEADVNSRDNGGRTALWWAALCGHEAVIKLLLETGEADVNSRDNGGLTALSWAARGGHEAVIKLLLETGEADVNSRDNGGWTALSRAAWNGREAVVKLLLETGEADVNSRDDNGLTALSCAAGHEAVVKLLESYSAS